MAYFIEPKYKIWPGDRFDRLTVTEVVPYKIHCICECGKPWTLARGSWGKTRSCGCVRQEMAPPHLTHGMTGTPTYKTWQGMITRCTNPKATGWESYGGRGITVCERWRSFENFLQDMGVRPEGLTLDRIDTNGSYEPGNCRWATKSEQSANRRLKEVCKWGHELTEENVYRNPKGKRLCRPCANRRSRERNERNAQRLREWRELTAR
ncbi:hypothetical protein ACIPSE_01425 [Streptomyces sp. NPDC090106]|uniref:hypothetical protein n=1 Tax=Streptomyces sp. NPDC090106 TaxID=3365946 RepID=UPI00382689F3